MFPAIPLGNLAANLPSRRVKIIGLHLISTLGATLSRRFPCAKYREVMDMVTRTQGSCLRLYEHMDFVVPGTEAGQLSQRVEVKRLLIFCAEVPVEFDITGNEG